MASRVRAKALRSGNERMKIAKKKVYRIGTLISQLVPVLAGRKSHSPVAESLSCLTKSQESPGWRSFEPVKLI